MPRVEVVLSLLAFCFTAANYFIGSELLRRNFLASTNANHRASISGETIQTTVFSTLPMSITATDNSRTTSKAKKRTTTLIPPRNDRWSFWIRRNKTERLDKARLARSKIILMWSTFWSKAITVAEPFVDIKVDDGGEQTRSCYVTTNKTFHQNATALWFNGAVIADLKNKMPTVRYNHQRWIVQSMEPAAHAQFHKNNSQLWEMLENANFNWSMTYTRWADVYTPFGRIRRRPRHLATPDHVWPMRWANFSRSFASRRTDAVVIISDCYNLHSKRFEIIYALMNLGVTIDVFGKCGNKGVFDMEIERIGEVNFVSNYRFFLAFENSLCEDYLSEKSFHAFFLNYFTGAIPIVHGIGNYSDHYPDGSYINVLDFSSLKELANTIKRLSKSEPGKDAELLSYYQWQKELDPFYEPGVEVEEGTGAYDLFLFTKTFMHEICRRLWQAEIRKEAPSTVDDIKKHFGDKCYELPKTLMKDLLQTNMSAKALQKKFIASYNQRIEKQKKP